MQKATEVVQELAQHVQRETHELERMQLAVKNKDEQILRWENDIMIKMDALSEEIKMLNGSCLAHETEGKKEKDQK